jgi:hypothetical protein
MKTINTERLPLYLSINDAIAVSGISRTKIHNRLKDGTIKARNARGRHMEDRGKQPVGQIDFIPPSAHDLGGPWGAAQEQEPQGMGSPVIQSDVYRAGASCHGNA